MRGSHMFTSLKFCNALPVYIMHQTGWALNHLKRFRQKYFSTKMDFFVLCMKGSKKEKYYSLCKVVLRPLVGALERAYIKLSF